MQQPHIIEMQDRLTDALVDMDVLRLVHSDLTYTIDNLGLDIEGHGIADQIITTLIETTHLETTEHEIHSWFQRLKVGGDSIIDILEEKMKDRADIIYRQVSPFFHQDQLVIDWGCGDGLVTNYIHNHITRRIEGWDVRHYPAQKISVPIKQFDGEFIPVSNGFFEAGLMTNVAHHEADNGKILRELARIICPGGRLVVIETVPIKDDPTEFERTFVNDYVYNRLFHSADVPVPGTYETEEGWIRRFAEVGFFLEEFADLPNPTPLGYDQPTIRDWHVRYVFRRASAPRA